MVAGRRRATWFAVSNILAQQANIHRDPKRSTEVKAEDCNPYARKQDRRRADFEVSAKEGIGLFAKALGAKVVKSIPGVRLPRPIIPPGIPGWSEECN